MSHQELGTENIQKTGVTYTLCVCARACVTSGVERGGRGASAPGPGPVGARAKLDFFFFDRKSVGDPGF